MVSIRCKKLVDKELQKLRVVLPGINQGMVEFQGELSAAQEIRFQNQLLKMGYEVLDDMNSKSLDRVLTSVTELIYKHSDMPRRDYPVYLIGKLGFDYLEITNLFSRVHGINLPRYIAIQQVEHMKEILLYENMKVKEMAKMLHYRNGAQLTRTFKEITGLTPSFFKKMKEKRLEIQKGNRS